MPWGHLVRMKDLYYPQWKQKNWMKPLVWSCVSISGWQPGSSRKIHSHLRIVPCHSFDSKWPWSSLYHCIDGKVLHWCHRNSLNCSEYLECWSFWESNRNRWFFRPTKTWSWAYSQFFLIFSIAGVHPMSDGWKPFLYPLFQSVYLHCYLSIWHSERKKVYRHIVRVYDLYKVQLPVWHQNWIWRKTPVHGKS